MRFRDFHPNVKIRIYVSFITSFAQSLTFPFMAIYFAHYFGEAFTGLLFLASILLSIATGFYGGYFADRVGRKKLMVLAEAVFFGGYFLTMMANSPWLISPEITAFTFLLISSFWGIYGPAGDAMLLDVTTSENRTLMYSIMYWSHNLTLAVGASIGAFFFEKHRFILFAVMTGAVLLSLLTTIFLVQETYDAKKEREERERIRGRKDGLIRNYLQVITDAPFMLFGLASLLIVTLEFQLQNYIGIRLAKEVPEQSLFGISFNGVNLLGFLQTENTVLVVLLAAFAAVITRRFPEEKMLYVGSFLYIIGYSVITAVNLPVLLLLAMLLATIGEVIKVPVQQSLFAEMIPGHSRSAYIAVNGFVWQGARVLSSLGVLLGTVLSGWEMGLVAFFMGVGGMFLYRTVMPEIQARREKWKKEEFSSSTDDEKREVLIGS
ncbi:MFS transporter [Thermicanus aegyptius]|uniref:MFS transporter n=1 Tax=Thermicanus aegyptius TaxID=94009 RepID=UPI0004271884|nr:MFS transporter [Thermicanus aegyptius]